MKYRNINSLNVSFKCSIELFDESVYFLYSEPSDKNNSTTGTTKTRGSKWQWRDLIPVIKVDISSVRLCNNNVYLYSHYI